MGDWTSTIYIISQVFCILAYVGYGYSYLIKNRALILIVVMASNVSLGIAFGLLAAWVGLGMCAVAVARDIVSFFLNAKRKEEDKKRITKLDCALLALWVTIITVITAFTYDGPLSLFAFFATFTFFISIWQKNVFIYRLLGVFVGIFWIVYHVFVQSVVSLALESALLLAVIVGLGLYIYQSKNKKQTALTND